MMQTDCLSPGFILRETKRGGIALHVFKVIIDFE
jgi:hypothetical protein